MKNDIVLSTLRERAGRLRHAAERDLAGEVVRRDEHVRNDGVDLAVARREGGQLLRAADDGEKVADHVAEAPAEPLPLGPLAAEQRDLLAVLAQPRQREAEIGFVTLLLEVEADQRLADQCVSHVASAGVDERAPDQEARHAGSRCPEW